LTSRKNIKPKQTLMKTIFKPLLFAILVIAGLRGFAQCAAPNFNYTINTGGQVNFYDYSAYQDTINGNPAVFIWNFGDAPNDTIISSDYQVNHTYSATGTYTVSLEIITTGCDSTVSQTFSLNPCHGGGQMTVANTGFGVYAFTSPNISALPGSTFVWDFGDGATSTANNPTHTYTITGNNTVMLIVTDPTLSCVDTGYGYFNIQACSYHVSIDTSILSFNPVDIQFQPSQLNASYSYAWAFGDGGTATGETVTHNYTASGTYTTTLTISDPVTQCSLSLNSTNGVNLCGGTVDFGSYGNGLTQNFSSSNFDTINGTANIASYLWSFPGATPSTATTSQVNNVVYSALGNYTVCLYATTTGGCIDTVCHSIAITPPTYTIAGTINKPGSTHGFTGTVYLIVQDSIGHLSLRDSITNISYADSSNGFGYYFPNVAVDTYYVKAALSSADPDYATYLPTYYANVLTWGQSTPVPISNASVTGIDVDLIEGTNPGGPGFVSGYVTQGAGLILGGVNNLSKSAGDPLQGVQINLLTGTGQAVAYAYTDVNGKYTFPNLALGSYTIYAEQLNKIPAPLDFTLTAQNPTDSGADITINSRTATGVNSVDNVVISDVYPNPVTSTVQLLIGCKQDANATIKLVDVLGRTAFAQQTKLASGQNTLEINMQTMAAGVYQLVIQTGSSQLGYKLVKAK
jgi:PKD repeat protein